MRRTLLAAAAMVAAAAGCGGGGGDGSSLDWSGFSGGGLVKPHRPFSWGGTLVYNRDSEPLTLRSVSLVKPTNGLRLRAAYAEDPDFATGLRRVVPAWRKVRMPLDGTVVPPRSSKAGRPGVGLLLVYEAGRGKSRYSGLSITYEREGDTYTQTIPSKLSVATKANPRA